jgi:type II secretory pathway pseudopilin PulG
MRIQQKKTVTLLEIMVAAFLLSAVVAGTLASFVAVRNYVRRAGTRLSVANLARDHLDRLYPQINAAIWDNASVPLSLAGGVVNSTNDSSDGVNYTVDYSVSNVTGQSYRAVTMNVTY